MMPFMIFHRGKPAELITSASLKTLQRVAAGVVPWRGGKPPEPWASSEVRSMIAVRLLRDRGL